jgi:exopolysaccharide biosynthesis polyprenyl glycosylphosphotransferase
MSVTGEESDQRTLPRGLRQLATTADITDTLTRSSGTVVTRQPRVRAKLREPTGVPSLPQPHAHRPLWRRLLHRLRAWMLVLPVDAVMLALPALWTPQHLKAFLVLSGLSILLVTGGSRYWARLSLSVLDDLPALLGRVLVATALVAVVTALRHEQGALPGFLAAAVSSFGLVVLGRVVTTQLILLGRRRGLVSHRALLIGGGPVSGELARILATKRRYGLLPVGFVDNGELDCPAPILPRLGSVTDIEDVVRRFGVEVAICADGDFSEHELIELVRRPDCLRCDLIVVPRLHQFHTQVGQADHIGAVPVMRIRTPSLSGPAWMVKRAFDILVSVTALTVLSPLLLLAAVAVRIEGGPGVLFRQDRVGRDGRVFSCLKFRSLRPATDDESATRWSVADDARIGPVGRLLRRTSFDELPQLLNILRGDMTLVGPRPERPHFVRQFSMEFPRYDQRLRVPAGLTGLAQVSGLRGDTPIADRARFDNYYIEHWSLWLDVKILLRTLVEVILAKGR